MKQRPRSIFAFAVLALCCAGSAAAPLTEHRAVERGLSQDNLETLLEARESAARGRTAAAGRWDNPELEYSREQLDLPAGDSEEQTWWLRQRINIAGVKGLERDAAARGLDADLARIRLARRKWRADIRRRFYEALAEQQRLEVLARHHKRLREIATVVQQQIDHGEASRYDGLRVKQELALVGSDRARAEAELQAARERLFALVGGEAQPLAGGLVPALPQSTSIDELVANHPRLAELEAQGDRSSLDAEAARRRRWPELTLGLGRKELNEPGLDAEGNTVSLGIEIPLFDRGSGEARQAESLAHQRRSDRALEARKLRADIRAARVNLRAQRRAALDVQASLESEPSSLTAIAESAYRGGEIGIMQLIDAYRTELTSYQHFIDSALEARMTYIRLQRLRGEP